MSVTFTAHPLPAPSHIELSTWCAIGTIELDPADAQQVADEHTDDCRECAAYQGPLLTVRYPFDEVNLANANAGEILTLLGYTGESLYAGSADADELLGKLLLADALLAESAERPYATQRTPGRATMVDLGRPAGYVNQRISQLADLASWAAANGANVVWS